MLVFALPGFESQRRGLLAALHARNRKAAAAGYRSGMYANGERFLQLGCEVKGKTCLLLGSAAPPDSLVVELTLLAHTLKAHRARRVIAILPYLAYARQDKLEYRHSLGVAWVGKLLRGAGIDQVVTLDMHSAAARKWLRLPTKSGSSARLFASHIPARWRDACVVAPDAGARERALALQGAAGLQGGLVVFRKLRSKKGVKLLSMSGQPVRRAVLVDDQLDTGATLVLACRALRRAGVDEMLVVVTHGLFTGKAWRQLFKLGVKEIMCTDSIPHLKRLPARIRVVPSATALAALAL